MRCADSPIAIAIYILGLYGGVHASRAEVDAQDRWQRLGHESFLDFLVALGCEQCQELLSAGPSRERPQFQLASEKFGCADIDVLLSSLHWIYAERQRRVGFPGLLVDGGANVGRATARWIAALGDAFGRRASRNPNHAPCIICAGASAIDGASDAATAPPTVAVASVEPSERNFALLRKHSEENGWTDEGWIALQAALGDTPGEATLAISEDFAIDEVATLLYSPDDKRGRQPVRVMTVDEVVDAAQKAFPDLDLQESGVFLLKLDIEGMEPAVLRSLRTSRVRVKFVSFEYASDVWREGLQSVVADLYAFGYFCFLITGERLFPVSGPFWDGSYELPMWSNLFCAKEDDPDLETLVHLHAGHIGLWPKLPNKYLAGYAGGDDATYSLDEAQLRCEDLGSKCAGVTCESLNGPCSVREGADGVRPSPDEEVTFLRDAALGEPFLLYRRAIAAAGVAASGSA